MCSFNEKRSLCCLLGTEGKHTVSWNTEIALQDWMLVDGLGSGTEEFLLLGRLGTSPILFWTVQQRCLPHLESLKQNGTKVVGTIRRKPLPCLREDEMKNMKSSLGARACLGPGLG